MYKYKTKDGTLTGVVPGVGVIADGVILSPKPLESANLELVHEDAPVNQQLANSINGLELERPNTITDAHPVAPENKDNGEQA